MRKKIIRILKVCRQPAFRVFIRFSSHSFTGSGNATYKLTNRFTTNMKGPISSQEWAYCFFA